MCMYVIRTRCLIISVPSFSISSRMPPPPPHSWQQQHCSLLFVVASVIRLVLAFAGLVVASCRHHHSCLVPTTGSEFPFRVHASDFVVIPTLCLGFHPLDDNHVVDS